MRYCVMLMIASFLLGCGAVEDITGKSQEDEFSESDLSTTSQKALPTEQGTRAELETPAITECGDHIRRDIRSDGRVKETLYYTSCSSRTVRRRSDIAFGNDGPCTSIRPYRTEILDSLIRTSLLHIRGSKGC